MLRYVIVSGTPEQILRKFEKILETQGTKPRSVCVLRKQEWPVILFEPFCQIKRLRCPPMEKEKEKKKKKKKKNEVENEGIDPPASRMLSARSTI